VTLVYLDPGVKGPATHALVIGIGDYPHLNGGAGALARHHGNMKQLTSPPVSAAAFASWLISSYDDPDRPLKTVDLLLSSQSRSYTPPPALNGAAGLGTLQVDEPTLAQMTDSALDWKQRGDENPENLLVFFYCGHGIAGGLTDFALVASDYGSDPRRPYDGLVSFPAFLLGMSDCASAHQCYFIDACRVASSSLIDRPNYGDPLVQKAEQHVTPGLAQSVNYSTLGGEKAHGRRRKPSVYTEALLAALKGPGATFASGGWRVNTSRLFEAVSKLMKHWVDPEHERMQAPNSGNQVLFDLNLIRRRPHVPFLLEVDRFRGPTAPPHLRSISVQKAGSPVAGYPPGTPPHPAACDWRHRHFEMWLEAGTYGLSMVRQGAPTRTEDVDVFPPGLFLEDW
jgi:hypothetical protein